MIRTTPRWLLMLVILATLTGCDNVAWGGIDVRLKAPPQRDVAPEEDAAPDEPSLPVLPAAPVLFRVDRAAGRSSITPVGEMADGSLVGLTSETSSPGFRDYFAQERMVGREFVLFAEGVRVGRFLAGDSVRVDEQACSQPPTVAGLVELIPEAIGTTRFLALDVAESADAERGAFSVTVVDQGWRVTAANVAGTVIMDAGARWPPSMASARGDVKVAHFREDEPPLLAGTYQYQDEMVIAEAPAESYSFFYLAENRDTGYRYSYYWFRVTGDEGKGAARYYGHMDWDGDGREDVLLEVLGADARWHAALTRSDTGFDRTFQDACGSPDQQTPQGE